jgi:hypothetical protein
MSWVCVGTDEGFFKMKDDDDWPHGCMTATLMKK